MELLLKEAEGYESDMQSLQGRESCHVMSEQELGSALLDGLKGEEQIKLLMRELKNVKKRHGDRIDAVEGKVEVLEDRVVMLEDRAKILETRQTTDSELLKMIQRNMKTLNDEVAVLGTNDETRKEFDAVIAEEKRVQHKVIELSFNIDTKKYLLTLIAELQAVYIAALAIRVGKFEQKKVKINHAKAVEHLQYLVGLLPVVGGIANSLIDSAVDKASLTATKAAYMDLISITDVADTISEYERVSVRIAVAFASANEEYLKALEGAVEEKKWKDALSIKSPLTNLLTWYMDGVVTIAEHRAKTDALRIIRTMREVSLTVNAQHSSSPNKAAEIAKEITRLVAESTAAQEPPKSWCVLQ